MKHNDIVKIGKKANEIGVWSSIFWNSFENEVKNAFESGTLNEKIELGEILVESGRDAKDFIAIIMKDFDQFANSFNNGRFLNFLVDANHPFNKEELL